MSRWIRLVPRSAVALWLALAPMMDAGAASAAGDAADANPAPEADGDQPPVFVPIEGLQVPIIEAGQMTGRLRIELVLQGVSNETLPLLRQELPRYRERALTAALEHARLHVSPYAAVDALQLSATLDAALKDPGLKRVLIVRVKAEPA